MSYRNAFVKQALCLPARVTVPMDLSGLSTRLRSGSTALMRTKLMESCLNMEIIGRSFTPGILGPLSLIAQSLGEKEQEQVVDGQEKYECRWGRKWFGNYRNLPRNSHTPYGNKKRLYKFRVKKQQFKHRQKKKRMKIAAIGNMPFNKKIRVQMTSRFEHINEDDVNAVVKEGAESGTAADVNRSTSNVGKRAKSKYTS
ncbi:hypothetical protein XU18_5032 [Perkinsela sp. CCAP 1560/4]|nr:hypothetical protein XU18_5032 [Perkinsela sp. CCAP 1560/4]|eukprot:KNH03628.1 hypothetical protein XU18_5032 [Perkinsela sp. CCAP 1560/4]